MARVKITTETLRAMKRDGEKIACLTAYDHLMAGVLDRAGVDLLIVDCGLLANLYTPANTPAETTL